MPCLKCGRETEPKEVFCADCIRSAAESPVKPGSRITIPKRPKVETPHTPAKKQTPEELIEKLRKQIKILLILIFALLLGLCISVGVIVHHQATTEHDGFGIGQNYSTEAPDDAPHGR